QGWRKAIFHCALPCHIRTIRTCANQEEPTMLVSTAVQPHEIAIDSECVYTMAPGLGSHRLDREHLPPAPAGRRQSAWEDQCAAVVQARLPRLQRLARRILHSDDLADDAVQEALVSLWQEGRLPPNPEGWLVRAVVLR